MYGAAADENSTHISKFSKYLRFFKYYGTYRVCYGVEELTVKKLINALNLGKTEKPLMLSKVNVFKKIRPLTLSKADDIKFKIVNVFKVKAFNIFNHSRFRKLML